MAPFSVDSGFEHPVIRDTPDDFPKWKKGSKPMRYFIQSLFTAAIILTAPATHAAQPCQNPAGDEGDQVYNITYHVMQYCNGTNWIAMGSHSASGDGLGDHIAGQALDMGGFRIQNLAPPTADNHAVTRAYVTSAIAAIPAPTAPNLSAVLATGNAAGNRKITGLATPTAGTDAAHKTYVDGKFGTLTNNKWCRTNSTQVICDQDAPAGDGDTLASLGCDTGQIAVKTAGDWGCADMPDGGGGSNYNHYFVMSSQTWSGNLGGISGANDKCLSELTSKNFKGKETANITADTVRAFLCDGNGCNTLKANTQYSFARAGSVASGGAQFTTNGSGEGPNDNAQWSGSGYFGASLSYWANYGSAMFYTTRWLNSPGTTSSSSTCSNWTTNQSGRSGMIGESSETDAARWADNGPACNTSHHIICIVNAAP